MIADFVILGLFLPGKKNPKIPQFRNQQSLLDFYLLAIQLL
jgi:hypothetical protein